jgi:outer membrane receptor protein involved in Fe transport
MDFTRSHHFVSSYDQSITKELRIKAEIYYQYIFNVPVELNHSSAFSLLNMGSGFERFFPDELINTGTGENYGIELTVEKTFHKNYFFLLTGSLYDSKYKGSDGILRNTDFNGNYSSRVMAGTEQKIGKGNTSLNFGGGITYAGGRRYSPVNLDSTLKSADVIFVDSERNTLQFKDFFRVDLRLGFKVEAKKVTHEFVLDIINLLDTKNILMISYDPDLALLKPGSPPYREEPQLGRLPVFFYKIHF